MYSILVDFKLQWHVLHCLYKVFNADLVVAYHKNKEADLSGWSKVLVTEPHAFLNTTRELKHHPAARGFYGPDTFGFNGGK